MSLEAFIIIASAVVVYVGAALLITFAVTAFLGSAVLMSRITFALLCGLVLHNAGNDIVASNFLNFLIWACIAFGIVMLLSLLPRTGSAIQLFCTIFMSVFAIYIVVSLVGSVIATIGKKPAFELPLYAEIIIKSVSTVFAIGSMYTRHERHSSLPFGGVVMENIDRAIGAFVAGVAVMFNFIPLAGHWQQNDAVLLIVLGVTAVIGFLADFFWNKERA